MTELVKAKGRTCKGFYVTTVSYVGCFSEPEIYYIDENGCFTSLLHDIAPGSNISVLYGSNDNILYTSSAKKIAKYVREEYAPYLVARFAKSCSGIEEIKDDAGYYICDKCGNKIDLSDEYDGFLLGVEHRSYGGLSYFPTKYVCNDCSCSNSCQYCGEYYEGGLVRNQSDYCEYCYCREYLKFTGNIYEISDIVKNSEFIKLTKRSRYFYRWKSYLNINR